MKIIKKNLLLLLLISPYILNAWGDGERVSNGGCQFSKETGYSGSSIYIKGDEAFIIIDTTDTRYGTTSTVYNAKSCKKVTSGDKVDSHFDGLFRNKGFSETNLNSNKIVDKLFQYKITFVENKDELIAHIEPITSSVTQELKILLASLSDKNANPQIAVSDSAKEFFGYRQFYSAFAERLNSLSAMEINYNYALSLNNKFQINNINAEDSKNSILSKQEDAKRVILAKQEEIRKRLAKIEEENKKSAIAYHKRMIKENLKIFAKNYGIDKHMKKDEISWKPNIKWDYHSTDHTITGKGTIWFNPDDSILDDVYIKGEFRNGRLISNGNLEIDGSKCLLEGIFSCRKSRGASDNKMVTAQNLATSISSLSSTVRDRVYERAYGGYNQKKSVGQKVCMSGNSFLWKTDVTAYVESVSGDRIQLRISDTEGQNPNYNGTTLRQGTIIWDDYNNWEPC